MSIPHSRVGSRIQEQRTFGAQVNLQAGLILEFMHKLGIHPCARRSQGLKRRQRFQPGSDQHAACGPGSLSTGLPFLDHQHVQALLAEFDRQRKSNNSGADNDRIVTLHRSILL